MMPISVPLDCSNVSRNRSYVEGILYNDIQYYDPILKKLKFPQKHKIRKLIELECIQQVSENVWVCKPIAHYSKTTHRIKRILEGFECSCQGYRTKVCKGLEPYCSHIDALKILLAGQTPMNLI